MQDYIGEKFLDKTYLGLYTSDIVKHTYHSNDKRYQSIRRYLDRLERLHKKAIDLNRTDFLYELYYKKYVIKEENIKDKLVSDKIINSQKRSLKRWLDLLFVDLNNYPMWARYYVFQSMLKMGSYDSKREIYLKRDQYTTNSFINANMYIVQKCLDNIIKIVNGDFNIEIKTNSFKKMYTYYEKQYKELTKSNSDSTIGVWIKYNQGSKEDVLKLVKSLENKNSHWCTENESWAMGQICGPYDDCYNGGDFYVYYTEDSKGEFTNPRIAIRMVNHNMIGEIRGIDVSQELELSMLEPLEKKICEMNSLSPVSKNETLRKIEGIRELVSLDKKISNNESISSEELIKFFSNVYGFGRKRHFLHNSILSYLKNNKEIVNREVLIKTARFSNTVFECVSDDILSDELLMLIIIEQNINVLRFIPEKLKDDAEFMLEAIRINHMAMSHSSLRLKSNREFIKNALRYYCFAAEYSTDEVKKSLKNTYKNN